MKPGFALAIGLLFSVVGLLFVIIGLVTLIAGIQDSYSAPDLHYVYAMKQVDESRL